MDTCPFLGPLVPLFWISGDVSSGFQSQSGLPYTCCGGKRNVRFLRSTSGATLADLLAASMQLVLSQILLQRWGCRDSNSCSQNICEPDTLPTELNRDRHPLSILTVTYSNLKMFILVSVTCITICTFEPNLHINQVTSLTCRTRDYTYKNVMKILENKFHHSLRYHPSFEYTR